MIVFGDRKHVELTAVAVDRLERAARNAAGLSALARHQALSSLLIDAGEVAQGLLDACPDDRQLDLAIHVLLLDCGRAVAESWRTRFVAAPVPDRSRFAALRAFDLPERITISIPEGYAFYALYPESYAEAALGMRRETSAPVTVVGIRSIGTSLGAIVAAAAEARRFVTVRPSGHPFGRRLSRTESISSVVADASPHELFAIVDEGPGLSGSSFLSVARFLEERGVKRDRIVLFPSHDHGPGPKSSDEARRLWSESRSCFVRFEDIALDEASPLRIGSGRPLADCSGGLWRALVYPSRLEWPAAHCQQERRKYIAGKRLLKFAGAGRYGEKAHARARTLGDAGFTPRSGVLDGGFIESEWMDASPARSFSDDDAGFVADYLSLLQRTFSASDADGASAGDLAEMATFNLRRVLGSQVDLGFSEAMVPVVEAETIRIAGDNRMHAWEWLRPADGNLRKCDALDHHASHDLIGCQDLAWDYTGAVVELGLSKRAAGILRDRLEAARGKRWRDDVLDFYLSAYLGFQVGYFAMAEEVAPDVEEKWRLRRELQRYVRLCGERLRFSSASLPFPSARRSG